MPLYSFIKSLLFLAGLFSTSTAFKLDNALKIISPYRVFNISAPNLPPDECRFPTPLDVCYAPMEIDGDKACVGVDQKGIRKHCGVMRIEDVNEVLNATQKVMATRRLLSSATVGNWTASYMLFTTHFKNTSIEPFEEFLTCFNPEFEYLVPHFYWSRGGSKLIVQKTECPDEK